MNDPTLGRRRRPHPRPHPPPPPDEHSRVESAAERSGAASESQFARVMSSSFGRNLGLVIALLILVVVGVATGGERFASLDNGLTILRFASVIGVVSIGMTFVITGGGIDLSVGAIVALSSVWSTTLATQTLATDLHWSIMVLTAGCRCRLRARQRRARRVRPDRALHRDAGHARRRSGPRRDHRPAEDPDRQRARFRVASSAAASSACPCSSSSSRSCPSRDGCSSTARRSDGARSPSGATPRQPARRHQGAASHGDALRPGRRRLRDRRGHARRPHHHRQLRTHGTLYELDAIAAVVIGGTLLSGGRGTIVGTVLGVLIFTTLTNVFTLNNLEHVDAGRGEGRDHRRRGPPPAAGLRPELVAMTAMRAPHALQQRSRTTSTTTSRRPRRHRTVSGPTHEEYRCPFAPAAAPPAPDHVGGAAAAGVLLAGCTSNDPERRPTTTRAPARTPAVQRRPGDTVVIGFSGPEADHGWLAAINEAATAEAAKYEDIDLRVAEGTNDANLQISQIETFINDGVDAIVLLPTDGAALDLGGHQGDGRRHPGHQRRPRVRRRSPRGRRSSVTTTAWASPPAPTRARLIEENDIADPVIAEIAGHRRPAADPGPVAGIRRRTLGVRRDGRQPGGRRVHRGVG